MCICYVYCVPLDKVQMMKNRFLTQSVNYKNYTFYMYTVQSKSIQKLTLSSLLTVSIQSSYNTLAAVA